MFAYGGGSDNYYGNYGGSGVGPTSYNPYGTGSPGQSVYTGVGTAAPQAGSVTDQYGGRVANNTVLTVTNKAKDHIIASGYPDVLLAQADKIISVAAYDNRDRSENYRAPIISIPNVGSIDFANSQTFTNYLTRSTTYLIPEAAVAAAFQTTLGRAPDQGNIVSLENLINAGGSLSTVQWYLAHTPEADMRINGVFNDVLGRTLDSTTLPDWENRLGTTSLDGLRHYLSEQPEATDRINEVYLQTLNHGVPPDSLAGRKGQLAASSLDAMRWDLAHTAEATGQLDREYRDVLNRGIDSSSIPGRQDQLGAHGSSLAAVQRDIAHSSEAADRINDIATQILDRPIDAPSLPWAQNLLAISSLTSVRLTIAQMPETTARINDAYMLLLGRMPGSSDVTSIEVGYLTQGGSIAGLRSAVANSPEARVDFDAAYYLQQNPDVAAAGMNPYLHYATYGWKEGRNPDAFFSSSYYLQLNPDVTAAGFDPLIHYRLYGWHEGRDPSADFNVASYLSAYPDVAAANMDPLNHYLSYGRAEGRQEFPNQLNAAYIQNVTQFLDGSGRELFTLPDNNIIIRTAREAFRSANLDSGSSAETKSIEFNVRQATSAFAIDAAVESGQIFFIKSEDTVASLLLQREGLGAVENAGTTQGVYEYIISLNTKFLAGNPLITHARFIPGGFISGHPNNFPLSNGTFRFPRYGYI